MSQPNATSQGRTTPQWKLQLLNKILYSLVVLGGVAVIFSLAHTWSEGQHVLLLAYGAIYVLLCVIAFLPSLGFNFRAAALLTGFLILGGIDLASAGLLSNGPLLLLGTIVLANTLFSPRLGIIATVFSLIILTIYGWLAVVHHYNFPLQNLFDPTDLLTWLEAVVAFIVISAIATIAIRYLVFYLENELQSRQIDYNFVSDVLDMAGTSVVVLTANGRIVRLNQNCANLIGQTITELDHKLFCDVFVLPAGHSQVKSQLQQLVQSGIPLKQELTAPISANREMTILWSFTLLYNTYIVATGTDISHQKLADRDREQLLLAEREQRRFAEALREAGLALTSTLNLDTLLDRLLSHIGTVVPYDAANIMLIDNNIATIARVRGYEKFGPQFSNFVADLKFDILTTANLRQLLDTRRPLVIPDITAYPGWVDIGVIPHLRSWIGAPIVTPQKVIACFSLDKVEPGFYQVEHLGRLEIFASQAALAMDNIRLFQAEARRRREAETLYNAAAVISSALDLPEVLNNILIQLEQVIPYDSACIFLFENNTTIKSVAGRGFKESTQVVGHSYPADDMLTQQIIQTGQPVILDDAQTNPHFRGHGGSNYVRGWMGVPLIGQTGVIGYLTLDNRQTGVYGPQNIDLAKAFATQATIALVNAQLFQAIEDERQLSDTLREFSAALVAAHTLTDVLNRILDYLSKVVPFDSSSVLLVEGDYVALKAARGLPENSKAWSMRIPIRDKNRDFELYLKKRPLIIDDVQQDPRWTKIKGDDYIRSWIGVPLIISDQVIGVLSLDHHIVGFYTDRHLAIAATFAHQAAIALEKATLFDAAHQRVAELEAIRQAALGLTSKLELPDVLHTILETTFKFVATAKNAHVFLYENDQLTFGASILADGTRNVPFSLPRRNGLTYQVAQTGATIVVPDMKTHPLYAGFPADWGGSIVGIPLKIGAQIVGVMTVSSFQSRSWSRPELRALELLADQAAIAIENARLYKQVQEHAIILEQRVAKRTFELQTLYQLTQALSQTNQFDNVLPVALAHLCKAIPHDVAAGLLVLNDAGLMVIQTEQSLSTATTSQIQQQLLNQLKVIPEKVDVQCPAASADQPLIDTLNSVMTAPVIVDQMTVGTLLVGRQAVTRASESQNRLLHTIADQAAETIRRLQLLLAAENQRLGSLIADLPNGIILLNPDRQIVLTNQMAHTLLPQLATGQKLAAIGRHTIEDILAQATTDTPYLVELDNGLNQVVEINANPVTAGPEIGGWTLVIRDVTEERLLQKRAQHQERLAAVGQLSAGIAHDFNNILTSIIGYAELLLITPQLQPELRDDVERIARQGQRAAHLVRQILDFGRQTITEKRLLDLVPLVTETIRLLERTLPENISIDFDTPPDSYVVTADLTQLQQVITNLAVNARDAMPDGGTLTLQLGRVSFTNSAMLPFSDMPLSRYTTLKVIDTGVGIAKENLEQIFEPFFTTKEVGKGTGLGLAQVYGIVKQHDGFIKVDSQPGAGATFTIYLPSHSTDEIPPAPPVARNMPQGQNELILLVEDDAAVLEIGAAMLQYLGYRVMTATNGFEAIELYRQRHSEIGLVLTDMTMPKMGGAELTTRLRSFNPAVKVIALTGYPLQTEAKKLLSEGIVDWLQKPLRLTVLGEAVQRNLRGNSEDLAN